MAARFQPVGVRGRSAKTTRPNIRASKSVLQHEKRLLATKPIGRGGGKNRGDRMDTSQPFSGDRKRIHKVSNPRSRGKQQIQGGGKARRGGGKKQKGSYDQPLMEY